VITSFRPDENYKRFNSSAFRMAMPEVPETIFMDGLNETHEAWIKKGKENIIHQTIYDSNRWELLQTHLITTNL
jgi:branched-subunit amino acid aminotransferase/4-amino-4-deoxychorismate lyase